MASTRSLQEASKQALSIASPPIALVSLFPPNLLTLIYSSALLPRQVSTTTTNHLVFSQEPQSRYSDGKNPPSHLVSKLLAAELQTSHSSLSRRSNRFQSIPNPLFELVVSPRDRSYLGSQSEAFDTTHFNILSSARSGVSWTIVRAHHQLRSTPARYICSVEGATA